MALQIAAATLIGELGLGVADLAADLADARSRLAVLRHDAP